MNNKQLKKTWQNVISEIRNPPRVMTPYSTEVVFTRELLLYAQVILEKLEENTKSIFYEQIYETIMSRYYERKATLKI